MYDMARCLVQRGHVVEVLTTDVLGEHQRATTLREDMDGVTVRRVPNVSNTLAWKFTIFLPLWFGRAFQTSLPGVDVVHLFDFRSYLNATAIGAIERRRVPYVLSAFGQLARATGPKRPAKALFDLVWGYRLVRGASVLLAQTDDEARWYRRLGAPAHRIQLVPLTVDLADVGELPPIGTFRRQLGISEAELLILFLGRIHPYKGVDLLIRSFAGLRAARGDVRLVIAGRDDGFLEAARALAGQVAPPGSVLFPGPVYGEARFGAYRDADMFAITPTEPEQTSLAALEACAVGTPVIVTEQASIPGLENARAGLVVPSNVPSVTAALARLLSSPDERRAMGERAARLVQEHFTPAGMTDNLERIYEEARNGRK
jgi:glycosyltransferase involved in cell wall biosynthesis